MIAALSFVLASALAAPPPTFFAVSPPLSAPALCSTASAASPAAEKKRPKLPAGITGKALCVADCGPLNGTVQCNAISTCTAVDQVTTCPMSPGFVKCDNNAPISCPACCTSGTFRTVTVGPTCGCDDGRTTPKDRYKCNANGLWEYDSSFCGGPFCQGL